MSQEHVRVVARAYEALANSGISAFSDYWSEDIDWRTMRDRWRGREAGRAYLQELVDMFDDYATEPIELIDAGNDQVVVYLRYGERSSARACRSRRNTSRYSSEFGTARSRTPSSTPPRGRR